MVRRLTPYSSDNCCGSRRTPSLSQRSNSANLGAMVSFDEALCAIRVDYEVRRLSNLDTTLITIVAQATTDVVCVQI